MFRRTYFAGLSLLPFLVACSHSLSHEELQSEYRASISLATETEVFLNHRVGHTYSAQSTQAHLSFLEKQGSDIQSDLASASAEPPDASSLSALKTAARDLTQTLDDLRSQTPNTPAQTSSIAHLDAVREHLQADMPR